MIMIVLSVLFVSVFTGDKEKQELPMPSDKKELAEKILSDTSLAQI